MITSRFTWSIDNELEAWMRQNSTPNMSVLECGSGLSTTILSELDTDFYSLEHNRHFYHNTRQALPWRHRRRVMLAPMQIHPHKEQQLIWYATRVIPPTIDLLLIDGPPGGMRHQARYPALPLLYPHLSPNARIVLHDTDRPDEKEIVTRWLAEFPLSVIYRGNKFVVLQHDYPTHS